MNKDLKGIGTEDLKKQVAMLGVVNGFLVGILLFLVVFGLFFSKTPGSSHLTFPLALSPVVIMGFARIGAIKKELRSRQVGK